MIVRESESRQRRDESASTDGAAARWMGGATRKKKNHALREQSVKHLFAVRDWRISSRALVVPIYYIQGGREKKNVFKETERASWSNLKGKKKKKISK